jgi:hypothetical protein
MKDIFYRNRWFDINDFIFYRIVLDDNRKLFFREIEKLSEETRESLRNIKSDDLAKVRPDAIFGV